MRRRAGARLRRRSVRGLVAVAAVGALAACGTAQPGVQPAGSGPGLSGQVVVFAAASLTDAFTALADDFTAAHPEVEVTLSFGSSSSLAQQVVAGAPADVFAAANPSAMRVVQDAGDVDGEPVVVARNRLQIAVPADNPGAVTGLADLADPARTVALCAPQVPCGQAAEQVFADAGLTPAPDTLERDVRAALNKVVLGEVDAALVYVTDVLAAGPAVRGVDVPHAERAANDYPVAVLAGAPNPDAAWAFVTHVRSPQGQRVLGAAGFDLP